MYASVIQKRETVEGLPPITIDHYPWYDKGLKQKTAVWLRHDDGGVHLHVQATDCHAFAEVLSPNGPVYTDSCFEFFFTPEGERSERYINLEINCVGTVYLAVRNESGKRMATEAELAQVVVTPSLPAGQAKVPEDGDEMWTLDIALPYELVASLWEKPISKERWYANFYRCGGNIDDQYAAWCPIEAPMPNFHLPEFFGQLDFEG